MASFLLYIIKSTCCLLLFYLGYKALLSNETFYRFNRGVLLTGISVCLLLPFVETRTAVLVPLQKPLLRLEEVIGEEIGTVAFVTETALAEVGAGEKAEPVPDKPAQGWGNLLVSVYFGGIAIGFGSLMVSFASMLYLLKSGRRIRKDGYLLILIGRNIAPFNWGKYILLSEKDYHDYPEEILTHELVHCRKRHSLDLIFAEAVILLHWFNPAVWLLKKELQEVHEFQADNGVLQSGIDATKYQLLLVKKAAGASSYTFANSFDHSKLKKRITMMLKEKSNNWARFKLALFIPVAACALVAFARPDMSRKLEQLVQSEGTTISLDGQSYTREFFDKEIDRYLEKIGKTGLNRNEKLAYLRKHTNNVEFFINAKDVVLFDGEIKKLEEIPAEINAYLARKYTEGRPVMFFFQHDRATSVSAIGKAINAVGNAFAGYRAAAGGKEMPVFFFWGNEKNYGNRIASEAEKKDIVLKLISEENGIVLKLISEDKQSWTTVIYRNDNLNTIRTKFDNLKAKNLSVVSIQAPGNTPMGQITDIKQALREVYDMRNNRIIYR